jgi:hypothetical protein
MLVSLLAFLAFLVCASMHKVAQARALGLPVAAQPGAHDAADRALSQVERGTTPCLQGHHVPPACELDAFEPQDIQEDARVDILTAVLVVSFEAIVPVRGPDASVLSDTWTQKFWVSSALPRGPPDTPR